MSIEASAGKIPVWHVGDRMRKSLDSAGMSVQEMAEYLGVNRNTVGRWMNGHTEPSRQTVRLWALRTGVPYAWLETGEAPAAGGPRGLSYTSRDLNPEPAGSPSGLVSGRSGHAA